MYVMFMSAVEMKKKKLGIKKIDIAIEKANIILK
jgi:hypothetical protein